MKRFLILLLFLVPVFSYSQHTFRSGIFLTHSTGLSIWGPNGSNTSIPIEIQAYNSTHGFSGDALVSMQRQSWPETPWDNEWERWHRIFKGVDPQANISPIMDENKLIVIKSCFPSSSMSGWGQPSDTLSPSIKSMYNYKWHWRNMIQIMRQYPDNFFTIWTNAPLNQAATNPNAALLSKSFCIWAKDTLAQGLDPVAGIMPPNVYVFDYFGKLTDENGYQRPEYAVSGGDSHPNAAATALIAPQFVHEIFDAALNYELLCNSFILEPEIQEVGCEAGFTSFSLTTLLDWTAESNVDWCTVTASGSGSATLTVNFERNPDITTRTATLIVKALEKQLAEEVFVVQEGQQATLAIYPDTLTVTSDNGDALFSVFSNTDWFTSVDVPWCTLTPLGNGDGQVFVEYEKNTGEEDRFAIIIITTTVNKGMQVQAVLHQTAIASGLINQNQNEFRVYPNPSTGQLTIERQPGIKDNLEWTLFDYLGRKLTSGILSEEKTNCLLLDTFPNGFYFLHLNNGKKQKTISLIRK